MGCRLVRPESLQMLSWTPFGSMASLLVCPTIVLVTVRSKPRLLRIILKLSYKSKPCFLQSRPILLLNLLITFPFFLNSFWGRCIPDCGPGVKARFKETLLLYFEAINIQAQARDQNIVPDLESYIVIRRDTSGKSPNAIIALIV